MGSHYPAGGNPQSWCLGRRRSVLVVNNQTRHL